MSGLQSVSLGLTMSFTVEPAEFVHVLHNGSGHWVTVPTVGEQHPNALIFYSDCPSL